MSQMIFEQMIFEQIRIGAGSQAGLDWRSMVYDENDPRGAARRAEFCKVM